MCHWLASALAKRFLSNQSPEPALDSAHTAPKACH
jgi:hypothetical protein